MRDHKELERDVSLVMDVFDQVVEEFQIVKMNSPQQTNTLTYNGWGSGDKVRTLSFKYSVTTPTRSDMENKVRSFIMRDKLR